MESKIDREKRYRIRKIRNDELDSAFSFVWKVFKQFVAPDYKKEGIDYFYNQYIISEDFKNSFINGLQEMYGAFDDERLIGVLSISKNNHVSCVFVDGDYQRKGIATDLFSKVISELKKRSVDKIRLNASPYAVPFYHAIGFVDTETEKVYHGIRYTPMELEI